MVIAVGDECDERSIEVRGAMSTIHTHDPKFGTVLVQNFESVCETASGGHYEKYTNRNNIKLDDTSC